MKCDHCKSSAKWFNTVLGASLKTQGCDEHRQRAHEEFIALWRKCYGEQKP